MHRLPVSIAFSAVVLAVTALWLGRYQMLPAPISTFNGVPVASAWHLDRWTGQVSVCAFEAAAIAPRCVEKRPPGL
jgi:hypothetical protein